jgi:hypothetical protein
MKAETKAFAFLILAILVLSAIIIMSFGISLDYERKSSANCPTDVKTCPDGSQVSRNLSGCEFYPCPKGGGKP